MKSLIGYIEKCGARQASDDNLLAGFLRKVGRNQPRRSWFAGARKRANKMTSRNVFITGGTGYIGQRLIPELLRRGHTVRALARRGSEAKLPAGVQAVIGDPLNRETFADQVSPADTFVQLVGVPHPSPAKAA